MLYLGGSCGCEGHNGAVSDLCDDSTYPTIFGSEVMPPLRYTVGFVYGVERDRDLLQKLDVLLLM